MNRTVGTTDTTDPVGDARRKVRESGRARLVRVQIGGLQCRIIQKGVFPLGYLDMLADRSRGTGSQAREGVVAALDDWRKRTYRVA
jgi:hypothetical protein